ASQHAVSVLCAYRPEIAVHECGMWNAECGMSVEASPRASTSHFNSAFRTPHSALLPHQRHRYIANYLERRRAHLIDRVFRRVPVRVVEVHDVDRVDARFLQGD